MKNKKALQVTTNDPGSVKLSSVVPPQVFSEVRVAVRGMTPLVTHKFSEKARKMMLDKQMGVPSPKKLPKVPMDDFNNARYIDDNGDDCLPAVAFKAAMFEAAKDVEGVTGAAVKRAILIIGQSGNGSLTPIKSDPPIMREDCVRLESGVADIRHRPEYRNWSVELHIRFNSRVINLDQLIYLLNAAGTFVGVCEMRPAAKNSAAGGTFGTFQVDTGASALLKAAN